MPVCVLASEINPRANIRLRFLPKPIQHRDFAFVTRLLELLDRFDAELVVQRFDFFRAKARNARASRPTPAESMPSIHRNTPAYPSKSSPRFFREDYRPRL